MKNQPSQDPEILDAIEACRPYSDDLSDPAMVRAADELAANAGLRDFRERLERFDARLAHTFAEVSPPEGLSERILARLADSASDRSPDEPDPAEQSPSSEPIASVVDRERRVSRRWLLVGTTAIVASSVMLVMVAKHATQPESDRPAVILDVAGRFFENDWDQSTSGRSVVDAPPHRDYAISPDVLQGNWVRWRGVSGFLGRRGVAYELTRPGGPRATLYVVKYPKIALPSRPLRSPALTTHNRSTSAWQNGPLLFVLVVEGGPHTYRGYLNLPSGPVT